METLPIAVPTEVTRSAIQQITPRLQELAASRVEANTLIVSWLQHSLSTEPEAWKSTDITSLGGEAFVAAVINTLPKKRMLTAAEMSELKREHAETIEPARQAQCAKISPS
jgi:hypothetical protein